MFFYFNTTAVGNTLAVAISSRSLNISFPFSHDIKVTFILKEKSISQVPLNLINLEYMYDCVHMHMSTHPDPH